MLIYQGNVTDDYSEIYFFTFADTLGVKSQPDATAVAFLL